MGHSLLCRGAVPRRRLPYQHADPGGLPTWSQDRPIENEDVVLWYTVGVTHFVRPEDWPIMPMTKAGFSLQPVGFFDRNPTLDIPPPRRTCCHSDKAARGTEQSSPASLPLGGRAGTP